MQLTQFMNSVRKAIKEGNFSTNVISLEKLAKFMNIKDTDLVSSIEEILADDNSRYKFTLMTLPNWATKDKYFTIYKKPYSHIRLDI